MLMPHMMHARSGLMVNKRTVCNVCVMLQAAPGYRRFTSGVPEGLLRDGIPNTLRDGTH
jgi:hypothetical protein